MLSADGNHFRLNGTKFYSTGTIYAEWADVYALREDGTFVIALARTDDPGFQRIPAVADGRSVVLTEKDDDLRKAFSLNSVLSARYAVEKMPELIAPAVK